MASTSSIILALALLVVALRVTLSSATTRAFSVNGGGASAVDGEEHRVSHDSGTGDTGSKRGRYAYRGKAEPNFNIEYGGSNGCQHADGGDSSGGGNGGYGGGSWSGHWGQGGYGGGSGWGYNGGGFGGGGGGGGGGSGDGYIP